MRVLVWYYCIPTCSKCLCVFSLTRPYYIFVTAVDAERSGCRVLPGGGSARINDSRSSNRWPSDNHRGGRCYRRTPACKCSLGCVCHNRRAALFLFSEDSSSPLFLYEYCTWHCRYILVVLYRSVFHVHSSCSRIKYCYPLKISIP